MRRRKCSKILIVLAALAACDLIAGCGSIQWQYNYDKAQGEAVQQRRRMIVEFASAASMACQEMDAKVFTNAEVRQLMQRFLPVRLDTVFQRDLARKFGVQTTPTFFVIRPDGQIVGSYAGKMDAEKFRVFLIKYSYN
jgi:thioredoxin-related protein